MRRVLFANSGSESNDTQIKLVRRYNNIRGKPQKKKIIARRGAYHGSTLGAGSLTGLDLVHRTFDLPISGVLHTHAADYHRRPAHIHDEQQYSRYLADELDRLIEVEGPETVAAFIAEPITGSGGVLVPPAGYFREIHRVLRKHDVLMIADEVITGFGRTGAWFASPGLDLEPDLITVAKGLSSGYFPVSAALVSAHICDTLYAEQDADGMFGHGFTSSGHPVGTAVALANIDILEREQLPQSSQTVGDYLIAQIRERIGRHELVGEIRGRGLLIGIEFDADPSTRRPFDNPTRAGALLSDAFLQERLFVRGGHGRVLVALAPPLVLSRAEADELVNRLERAVHRFAAAVDV
jgi:L-2,4-diaminobutyrate transaminase